MAFVSQGCGASPSSSSCGLARRFRNSARKSASSRSRSRRRRGATRRPASPVAAPLGLGASPAEMGLLGAFEFAPFLLLSLFAGVWVDRLRRRPILIAADIGRALLLGSIPGAALLGV